MRRIIFALMVSFLVLWAVVAYAQRGTRHVGAKILIEKTGAVTITPKTGQGVTVGATGTALTGIAKYTATLSPASVAANTCAAELFTVTGIAASDVVYVNKPTSQAGLGVAGVRASATNQVEINFCNTTASPIVPTASQVYRFGVLR